MTGSSRGVEEPDSGITYDERVHLRPGALVPGTRYRLERWLGEGSMGVVYEALHVDIERRVALKILHHEVSDHELVLEGFQTEARASARIGAPNIVEVFDFATLADGRPLMAMEYLEGSSVDRVLEDLRADPGRLIGVMRQVCKGLGAAHEAGIVHRDIKPDNIMLVERAGRRDFVKIVDFGVAAPIDRSGETGRLVGTPSYIAPEIVRREAFDGRVDVYAVGCVMYEALVGEPPFVGSSTEHILHLQLEARPVRPSERAPSAAPPPRALEAVVMRCLAKKPGDRYRDMADLEAALCEAQIADGLHSAWDDLPLPEVDAERRAAILKGMPDPARLVRSARRRGFLVAGGGLLVAIVVVLVTLSGVLNPSGAGHPDVERLRRAALDRAARALYVYPPAEEPRAVTAYQLIRELEELDHDEDYAQTIASELRDEFAETLNRLGDRYWSREGGLPFAIDYYAQTLLFVPDDAHARERASVSPGTLAALHQRASSGEFAEAELVAVEPLRVLAEPDEAERDRKLASLLRAREGKRAASSSAQLEALLEGSTTRPVADKPRAETTGAPAPKHVPQDMPEEPGETTDGVEATTAATDDSAAEVGERPEDPDLLKPRAVDRKGAAALVVQARAALDRGERSAAETLFTRALALDSNHRAALEGLAELYYNRGDYSEAVDFAKRLVRAAPRDPEYRILLGDAYYKVLRLADARDQYTRALELGHVSADARIRKVDARLGQGDSG